MVRQKASGFDEAGSAETAHVGASSVFQGDSAGNTRRNGWNMGRLAEATAGKLSQRSKWEIGRPTSKQWKWKTNKKCH